MLPGELLAAAYPTKTNHNTTQNKSMKKLFTILLLSLSAIFARAENPVAVKVDYISSKTEYYVPDQLSANRTSSRKARVFSLGTNVFYSEDTVDNGAQFAQTYGFQIYRVRNTWSSAALVDPVHSQSWQDSQLVYDEYDNCGGSCYPELYPDTFCGGFSTSYSNDPQWGNAYYSTGNTAQTRVKINNGDPAVSYYVEVAVSIHEFTDRSPSWGSVLYLVLPANQIRISGGVLVSNDYRAIVTVPGNGATVNITPYAYPARALYSYNIAVMGIVGTSH